MESFLDQPVRSTKPPRLLRQSLARQLRSTVANYRLFDNCRRLLVGISGGIDSLTLLDLLAGYCRANGGPELIVAHVVQSNDRSALNRLYEHVAGKFKLPFIAVQTETEKEIKLYLPPGKAPCSICSRIRRRALVGCATENSCEAIALGHHLEDALETLFLNILYRGRVSTFRPKEVSHNVPVHVVRPLYFTPKREILLYGSAHGYPLATCGRCGPTLGQRGSVRAWLQEISRENVHLEGTVRRTLLNLLANYSHDFRLGGL